jgi:hypothetical protein
VNRGFEVAFSALGDNGGNVPGKSGCTWGYTGGIPEYRRRCDEIAADGYAGFKLA